MLFIKIDKKILYLNKGGAISSNPFHYPGDIEMDLHLLPKLNPLTPNKKARPGMPESAPGTGL
ncbi:hypothetical protein D1B31_12260 [Neobacillus notoginsengisoli]|uniref:Uncharacterized protein n=1 Tax=Neobacillus notoginsengisoli TaxID=1578198 RepID=A0A417YTF6_9BACI|nr:hypothetical protein [Neobacillus notoginsengisoli]RHW40319.1 hypothetical protein D1B31_12260 [Neobacillus notoginsengisoli]